MREVKVPDFMQPFEVIVNGVKHVFPAGKTVTVEDYIADIIEQSVPPKAEAKVERVMWEDIGNRPFGYSPTGGDTLTWDGNTEGLVSTVGDDFALYKVCDVVPSVEDVMKGAIISISTPMGSAIYPVEAIEMGHGAWATDVFFGVPESAVGIDLDGIVFSESGLYAVDAGSGTTISLQINGYTGFPVLKKIEPKYLPETILLHLDEDKYLYETPDTSDPANRITMARLKEIALSPCQKYVYGEFEGGHAYVSVLTIQFVEDLGYGTVLGVESLGGYTAEYTPST